MLRSGCPAAAQTRGTGGPVGRLTGPERLALAHTLLFSIGDGINGRFSTPNCRYGG
jgi:hypothetical protein